MLNLISQITNKFSDYVLNAMSWQGRLSRRQYFIKGFTLSLQCFCLLLATLFFNLDFIELSDTQPDFIWRGGESERFLVSIFLLIVFAFYVLASTALTARRLQDFDFPGKWALLYTVANLMPSLAVLGNRAQSTPLLDFVSYALAFIGLIILFKPGNPGPNQYGLPPHHKAETKS